MLSIHHCIITHTHSIWGKQSLGLAKSLIVPLDNVVMDPEHIPGTLDAKQEYTLAVMMGPCTLGLLQCHGLTLGCSARSDGSHHTDKNAFLSITTYSFKFFTPVPFIAFVSID